MEGFNAFIDKVQDQIIDPIITLIALAAFVLFAWGVVQFIAGAADEDRRSMGRRHMLWGVIGLAIVFGAQVIVTILKNIVGVQ